MSLPRTKTAGRAAARGWALTAVMCGLSVRLFAQAPVDEPKKNQIEDKGPPPAAPAATPADTGALPVLPRSSAPLAPRMQRQITPAGSPLPKTPNEFNPDPGATTARSTEGTAHTFFRPFETERASPETAPLPPALALPRTATERPVIFGGEPRPEPRTGMDPLPADQALPRTRTRSNRFISPTWDAGNARDRMAPVPPKILGQQRPRTLRQ